MQQQTFKTLLNPKIVRSELIENKDLKARSNAAVEDMQNQISKQQPCMNSGTKIQKVVRGHK